MAENFHRVPCLSVKPNKQTELKISSKSSYDCMLEILKVICADIDPNGPGEQYEKVSWFKKQKIGLFYLVIE